MHRKRETRRSRSIQQKVGAAVRLSQEPSDEDELAEYRCMRGDARTAVQERSRDGTQEVLPRTATPVVLKASADHAVVEFCRREDRTAFSERQWRTEDSREAHKVVSRCAQDAYSRVQPAGGDSREVCSTVQVSR